MNTNHLRFLNFGSRTLLYQIIASSILLGALIFGTAFVAPIAITTLGETNAGSFLRKYWVVYHRLGLFGSLSILALTLAATPLWQSLGTSIFLSGLAIFSAICFLLGLKLIPEINAARDADQNDKFKKLHLLDVVLVGLAQLALIGSIIITVTL